MTESAATFEPWLPKVTVYPPLPGFVAVNDGAAFAALTDAEPLRPPAPVIPVLLYFFSTTFNHLREASGV